MIIKELCLKGYENVDIPSPRELFLALGERSVLRNRSTDDPDDFTQIVNDTQGLSKVDTFGAAVAQVRHQRYLEERSKENADS